MSVAAQAICNLREFSDVGYNYYSEWDDDDDEKFIVQFYWEDFQYTWTVVPPLIKDSGE